jgi:micrococcal nuclease
VARAGACTTTAAPPSLGDLMRWFALLLTAVVVVLAGGRLVSPADDSAGSAKGRTSATVDRVTDGDTVRLSGIGRTRLIGVDTPEVYGGVECYGREASAFAKRVLKPGTRVTYKLGVEPRDRYGRALAYVWLADGRFFNEMLVERGYATQLTIPPNVDYVARFRAAARRAREHDRGLWSPRTCAGRNDR